MRTSRHRLAVGLFIAGCQSAPAPVSRSVPEPETRRSAPPVSPPAAGSFERGIVPRTAPPLPAIPLVVGPLSPHVVYPEPNQIDLGPRFELHLWLGRQRTRDAHDQRRSSPRRAERHVSRLSSCSAADRGALRVDRARGRGQRAARGCGPRSARPTRPGHHGATRHRFSERVSARRIDDAARERAGARLCPRAHERDRVGGGERRRSHVSARQHGQQLHSPPTFPPDNCGWVQRCTSRGEATRCAWR